MFSRRVLICAEDSWLAARCPRGNAFKSGSYSFLSGLIAAKSVCLVVISAPQNVFSGSTLCDAVISHDLHTCCSESPAALPSAYFVSAAIGRQDQ